MSQDRYGHKVAPVKVGDEVEVRVEAVGGKGDGIAKKDGFVLFVPGTKAGDNVRIKITRVLDKVGFAEVVGKAEGKKDSGRGNAQAEGNAPKEPEPKPEEEVEDTEDFGEDLEEK